MYFYIGKHTFAAVRADENYEVIAAAFKEPIKEVNELVRVNQIMVKDYTV